MRPVDRGLYSPPFHNNLHCPPFLRSDCARHAHGGAHHPYVGRALYIQSVEEAASVAGGYERLAAHLGVATDEVKRWCSGTAIPECAVLLRVIELVLTASAKPTETQERLTI